MWFLLSKTGYVLIWVLSEIIVKHHQNENHVQLFRGPLPIKQSCVKLQKLCNWKKVGLMCNFFGFGEKRNYWATVEAPLWVENTESMLRLEIGLNVSMNISLKV